MDTASEEQSVLATFIRFDIIAAGVSLVFLIGVQLIFVNSAALWIVPGTLALLIALLFIARDQLGAGRTTAALALVAGGNWIVTLSVPFVLPFLWPVVAVAALIPVVLAAPSAGRRAANTVIACGSVVIAIIAIIGLLGDDRGVITDIDDDLELIVVVGALAALAIPIGLVVTQANLLQRRSLARADALNAELRRSEGELAASRRRVVDASDSARSQIERDLHDGAQQHLVALGVHLRLLASRTEGGTQPDDLPDYISMLTGELDLAIDELRELAHGIYPPLLEARGLVEAFGAVVRRSPVPIAIDAGSVGRFDRAVESALYFTGLEALANSSKHAPGASVQLRLVHQEAVLSMTIADTGPGFDADGVDNASGLFNMRDRMEAVGGSCAITASPEAGTLVVAEVPAP